MFTRRILAGTRQLPVTLNRRAFHQTSPAFYPRKDSQDRNSMNTEPSEYSKSGTDSAAASATDSAAFDPNQTRPEQERETAKQESGSGQNSSPLDASPANQNISKPRNPTEGGPEGSEGETGKDSDRQRTSGGGSAPKSGGGKSGGSGSGV